MNAMFVMKLLEEYSQCPCCGNQRVGNREGKISVTDDEFIRECKCGWRVVIDKNGNKVNEFLSNKEA